MSEVHDLTVEVLKEIRDDVRDVKGRLGNVEVRLGNVENELRGANRRIDNLIATFGSGYRSHDDRILDLERRVERLEGEAAP